MNKRVIAIVTAMLETLETSPDTPDAEVEELVKQTLQLISGRKPSTIRALGDAFMNFAEDKPWLAATIVITIWAVPQKIIEEAWRSVYPPKVQIEVQEPQSGRYVPWNDSTMHGLMHTAERKELFADGLGIEYHPSSKGVEYERLQENSEGWTGTTRGVELVSPAGHRVTFTSSNPDRSMLRTKERERCSGDGYCNGIRDACDSIIGTAGHSAGSTGSVRSGAERTVKEF